MITDKNDNRNKKLPGTVGKKAARRIKARRTRDRSVWFGVGLFGMVGWTVAITTIIGVVIGIWLDRIWPGPYSWTLTFLIIGLIIGCINAWYWINKESKSDDDNYDQQD
ncbi:MAG: AtpZ/AtpI family protein [Bacillota bacterium]|nr:AtpZ/AtpI family protein [Bacillota bacterium]